MNAVLVPARLTAMPLPVSLCTALADLDTDADAPAWLSALVARGQDLLPLPARGGTLQRWQALAAVAEYDLSLAKLFEGHTDALAILAELGETVANGPDATWGTWAAESPNGRVTIEATKSRQVTLRGTKSWCSGAAYVSHGLLTAWYADGRGPQLVRVAMNQPGVMVSANGWRAVGMSASASIDVAFDGVTASLVGGVGDYLERPGFWQGGAGIAACWWGGSLALGSALRHAVMQAGESARNPFRLAALGKVDLALQSTAAVLRHAAHWMDKYPRADASKMALRTRLAAEDCARRVLDETGRALGAGAFCRDARFARMAADLPVFVRQSHGDRDFASLGERLLSFTDNPWLL
ncbi:MAG: acyl-CoA dehydrogenase [Burkholderiales bacterium]